MFAIYKKELRAFFINPIGYVYLGVFLAVSALVCCYSTIVSASYSTSRYFQYMIFGFVILIPLLTMRLFAEERKLKTEQLLLTAPVTITGMVMGKFLAAMTVFGGSMVVSLVNFIPLYVYGAKERAGSTYSSTQIGPITGQIIGSFFALLLLGAAFIAIGTFISALTENQLSSAVITIGVIAGMVFLNILNSLKDSDGQQIISSYPVRFVISWISVYSRFGNFSYGMFDFSATLYYCSLAFIFLFLTIRVYDKRRWG